MNHPILNIHLMAREGRIPNHKHDQIQIIIVIEQYNFQYFYIFGKFQPVHHKEGDEKMIYL